MRAFCLVSARRIDERRRVLLQLVERASQRHQQAIVETGADLAGVAQLPAGLVHAKQQGAEAPPAPLRVGKSADDHFLPLRAFHLEPLARSHTVAIQRVRSLGHGAFQAKVACLRQELLPRAEIFHPETQDGIGLRH